MGRNIVLYPWFKFAQSLVFWQAVWFLYFQNELSAAEAILLYAIYDICTTALEVPSGYMSDRLGRKITLIFSALAGLSGAVFMTLGDSFLDFALIQILIGASGAFASGTDSSILYESLEEEGRADEVERQELKSWRFSFSAFALSAVTGGAMSLYWDLLPYVATAVAFAIVLIITLYFKEPGSSKRSKSHLRDDLRSLKTSFQHPVLIWLFVLSLLMYLFSHVPFVFGQPFILDSLSGIGWDGTAPFVSGAISSLMMLLSVLVSSVALRLRQLIGLPAILLLAFALQIALIAVLSASSSIWAIGFLVFRMIPSSLSTPFILARIQPLLSDTTRATYLSLQSLCGRLFFAVTLWFASSFTSARDQMIHSEIQLVLWGYTGLGVLGILTLFWAATRIQIDPGQDT